MIDPSYALQQAVYTTLTSHPGVAGIVGTVMINGVPTPKVFHRVPSGTALPYVVIGQDIITSDYDTGEFSDCDITVHVFANGLPKAKQLAAQVVEALNVPIVLTGFSTHTVIRGAIRHLTDPDGLTGHSVIEFEYKVQAV